MSFTVRALRREFEVRKWSKIIERHPYVAVLQMTDGPMWGRTNMKARLLGPDHDPSRPPISLSLSPPDDSSPSISTHGVHSVPIDARFAVPRHAREGALRTSFVGLSPLFRSAGSAVVYGTELARVTAAVKRSREVLKHAELVGGRFGNNVVTARTWNEVLESEGELAEWTRLLSVLQMDAPGLVHTLELQGSQLVTALQGGGGQRVVRVLEARARGMEP